jgi:hypothetical protein
LEVQTPQKEMQSAKVCLPRPQASLNAVCCGASYNELVDPANVVLNFLN